jgi:hypothetical protein
MSSLIKLPHNLSEKFLNSQFSENKFSIHSLNSSHSFFQIKTFKFLRNCISFFQFVVFIKFSHTFLLSKIFHFFIIVSSITFLLTENSLQASKSSKFSIQTIFKNFFNISPSQGNSISIHKTHIMLPLPVMSSLILFFAQSKSFSIEAHFERTCHISSDMGNKSQINCKCFFCSGFRTKSFQFLPFI